MRIALVAQEYPPQTAHGGIATQTYAKALGLSARGHEVHVLSHSVDGERHEYADGAVRVTRIPGFDRYMTIGTQPARWVTYSALVAAELAALHARAPLDIVDFPEWASEAYVHLLNREASCAPRAVIHLHGPLVMLAHTLGWPELDSDLYRTGRHMEQTCLRLADAVVSSSRCSLAWCAEHYGIDAQGAPVIHTGVDTRVFHPGVAARSRRPTVLFVGRVAESKGIATLVEACCEAERVFAGLRLRVVGRVDEALAARLHALAGRRGCEGLLDFAGYVPRAGLPQEYCSAHLLAAPSRYEGGPGFVYLEAMACGTPVIGCSGSGSAEVIAEDRGVLVPPDDAQSLAQALGSLLADEARRARMGARGREYVIAEADTRVCVERLERFYASVAGAQA